MVDVEWRLLAFRTSDEGKAPRMVGLLRDEASLFEASKAKIEQLGVS